MKRIAVLTSGGDAPGMNAAIRAVVRSAIYNQVEVFGIMQGYEGLIQGCIKSMNLGSVADIIHRGGTILQTSRSSSFMSEAGRRAALEQLNKHGITGLVVLGGNGSLRGAWEFSKLGIKVVGIPASIDNDIVYTRSIGFDTAVNTALQAINHIRDTATSHGRVFVIEVMGRDCGEIALAAGVAGGAESILIPEIEVDFEQIVNKINQGVERGKLHSIIVVAEGAMPVGGEAVVQKIVPDSAEHLRLGGISLVLGAQLEKLMELETRAVVLGHLQRGGTPTPFDRILATRLGSKAIDLIEEKKFGQMVSVKGNYLAAYPLEEVAKGPRLATADHEMIKAARAIGVCFGS